MAEEKVEELPARQEQKPKDLRTILTGDAMLAQFEKALPKHLSADRFIRVACTMLLRVPLLAECTHESFFKCMLDLSAMGLEPDGVRAHLIPFRNNQKSTVECTLIIDYKGMVELVRRSGDVVKINADVICDGDTYVHEMGEVVSHTFSLTEKRGEPIAAYAQVKFRSGDVQCVIMTTDEIESIRARSKSGTKGPWVTDWKEMAKKTAFRRLCKWLTLSPEVHQYIAAADETEFDYQRQQPMKAIEHKRTVPVDPFKQEAPGNDSNG